MVQLEERFDFFFEDNKLKVWGRTFSCIYDGPLTLQVEEVENGSFIPIPSILRLIATEPFARDSLEALRRYLHYPAGFFASVR